MKITNEHKNTAILHEDLILAYVKEHDVKLASITNVKVKDNEEQAILDYAIKETLDNLQTYKLPRHVVRAFVKSIGTSFDKAQSIKDNTLRCLEKYAKDRVLDIFNILKATYQKRIDYPVTLSFNIQ